MLCSNAGVHFYNYFIFLPDKTFVSGENEFAEIIDEEPLPEVQIAALDNLFDDILPLPNTPTTSNAASMATSPQNSTENPVASTSKDPVNQAGIAKTTPTPNAQKTPPSGTPKSPRNATAAKTFTRRRDADSSKAPPPPPEYVSKDDIRKTKWKNIQFCADNSPAQSTVDCYEDFVKSVKTSSIKGHNVVVRGESVVWSKWDEYLEKFNRTLTGK